MAGDYKTGVAALLGASAIFFLAAGGLAGGAAAATKPAPVVAEVHGELVAPGITRLTIQGDNFMPHSRVSLGGGEVPTTVHYVSRRLLIATVDALTPHVAHVRVATAVGKSSPKPLHRVVVGPLSGVSGLSVHVTSENVTLKWQAPARKGVARIVVQRGTKAAPRTAVQGVRVASLGANAGKFVDKHVTFATTYRYAIFVKYYGRGYAASVAHAHAKTGNQHVKKQLGLAAVYTAAALAVALLVRWLTPASPTQPSGRKPKKRDTSEVRTRRKGVITGADGRYSTSKTIAWLWTLVVVFFLIAMALIAGVDAARFKSLVDKTDTLYLWLIGGPFAAAVAAKMIVVDRLRADPHSKSTVSKARIADLIRDDNGDTDLADAQYILFNVVAAAIVIVQFCNSATSGPPTIPSFLASIAGVSAAAYTANKGVRPPNQAAKNAAKKAAKRAARKAARKNARPRPGTAQV